MGAYDVGADRLWGCLEKRRVNAQVVLDDPGSKTGRVWRRPRRTTRHLGEGELGLQHGQVVAVPGAAVAGGEGVRQAGQPLAYERV
ncbi:MAG: hypothetical protein ACRDZN_04520, partial [Acidimicrobiales bacterium]